MEINVSKSGVGQYCLRGWVRNKLHPVGSTFRQMSQTEQNYETEHSCESGAGGMVSLVSDSGTRTLSILKQLNK